MGDRKEVHNLILVVDGLYQKLLRRLELEKLTAQVKGSLKRLGSHLDRVKAMGESGDKSIYLEFNLLSTELNILRLNLKGESKGTPETQDLLDQLLVAIHEFEKASSVMEFRSDDINNIDKLRSKMGDVESTVFELQKKLDEYHEHVNTINKYFEDGKNGFDEKRDEAVTYISKQIGIVDKLNSEIRAAFQIASENTLSGGYKKSASRELKSGTFYRILAIVLIGIFGYLVGDSLIEIMHDDYFDWKMGLVRFSYLIALSVPITYFSREGSKHMKQYYRFNQTALDINSVGSFISSLDDDAQSRIMEDVAKKIFGPKTSNGDPVDSFPINAQDLLMTIINRTGESPQKATLAKS